MDILLISLQKDLDVIGLNYLHYYLLKHSYNSTILFLPTFNANENTMKGILNFVNKISPKLIGISLMSTDYDNACHLTKFLKKHFKSVPVVWGGIHPTIAPEMCLEYSDYVCIGECEKTILDIANTVIKKGNNDLTQIRNLCYKEGGQVKRNDLYPLIDNLDEIPSYDHVPINSYIQTKKTILVLNQHNFRKYARFSGTIYNIMSSRGCPFACTYCCNNFISRLYNSRKVRRRSTNNIISELKKAINDNPYIEYINFQDDCFMACSNKYLNEFCEIYKKEIKRPFIVRGIPVYITEDKVKTLKSSGIGWITMGLQSGSDYVNREIYKRKSLKADFLNAAKIIKKYNIAAFYDIMLDNPFETEENQFETIQTLTETPKPFHPQLFSLVFYFGTEMYERTLKECPENIDNSLKKDNFLYNKVIINDITRLAIFLGKKHINKLVHLYKINPESFIFKFKLLIAKLQSSLIFEPLTYLRVINLSVGGNLKKTLKVLPHYFFIGFPRYLNQFRTRVLSKFSR
jgi:radical SAM superfamily enzyme YgiQ (UPF0313 family)